VVSGCLLAKRLRRFRDRVQRVVKVPTTEVSRQRVSSWIRADGCRKKDAAQYPVNRGIVAGEPAVS